MLARHGVIICTTRHPGASRMADRMATWMAALTAATAATLIAPLSIAPTSVHAAPRSQPAPAAAHPAAGRSPGPSSALNQHDSTGRRWIASADGLLSHYAADGQLLWRQGLGTAAAPHGVEAQGLQVDAAGRSTLLGTAEREPHRGGLAHPRLAHPHPAHPSLPPAARATDILLIRRDADGRLLWQTRYRESEEGTQRGWALALGADGSTWVVATMAMDRSGQQPELPMLLRFDAGGRASVLGVGPLFGGCAVVVIGHQVTVAGPGRVSRFEPDGLLRWTTRLPGAPAIEALAPGPAGQVIAIGRHGHIHIGADGAIHARPGHAATRPSRRAPAPGEALPPLSRQVAQRAPGRLPTTPCTSQSMPAI